MTGAEQQAWDGWASAWISKARAEAGEGFDSLHDTAPLWRFLCGPGLFGTAWCAGAMAPSLDRAGRRFVIIMAYLDLTWTDVLEHGEHLAHVCAETIYRTFGDGLDGDRALAALAESPLPPGDVSILATLAAPATDGLWWTSDTEGRLSAVLRGAPPPPDDFIRLLVSTEEAP